MKKGRFNCLAAFGAILFTVFVIFFIPIVFVVTYYRGFILKLLGIALAVSVTVGVLTGGGHAVYNYIAAFKKNVKPG
jgi:hypothetical protein